MTLQQINPMPNLTPGLLTLLEFQATIDDVVFTFRPVGRCPASRRNVCGHSPECRGIWRDYQQYSPYTPVFRFCPKKGHAQEGQTDRLVQYLREAAEAARKRKEKDGMAAAERRYQKAAVAACEGVPVEALEAGVVKELLQASKAAIQMATIWVQDSDLVPFWESLECLDTIITNATEEQS